MFGSLIRRAEISADAVVAKALARVAIAALFVVAGSFGTAALAIGLSEAYGPVVAYGSIATIFAMAGAVVAVAWGRGEVGPPAGLPATPDGAQAQPSAESDRPDWADLLDIAKIAAPVAAPVVVRTLLSRRPLMLLALAAFVYLMLRGKTGESSDSEPEPAPLPAE